jgi:hypothetical protein
MRPTTTGTQAYNYRRCRISMSCSHRKDEHNRPDTTIETLALQRSSLETLPMKQCEGPPSRQRVDGMATRKELTCSPNE